MEAARCSGGLKIREEITPNFLVVRSVYFHQDSRRAKMRIGERPELFATIKWERPFRFTEEAGGAEQTYHEVNDTYDEPGVYWAHLLMVRSAKCTRTIK